MHIVAAALLADPSSHHLMILVIGGAVAAMAVGAAAIRIFTRGGIEGPVRLGDDLPLEPLGVAMAGGFLTYLALSLLGQSIFLALNVGGDTDPAAGPTLASIISDLIGRVGGVAAILFLIALLYPRRPTLGFSAKYVLPGLERALLGILIVLPLVLLAALLTERLIQPQKDLVHDYLKKLAAHHELLWRSLILFSVIVVAPITEELMFRGCLQTVLLGWINQLLGGRWQNWMRWSAVVLCSLMFAWAHDWWSRPPIFVLSLCLGFAYERTGNLWTAIFIHSIFNTVEITIFFWQLHVA
jgi:membrane protease YdiL (CAAX protease family)